ncbi:uncharacterized protein LOC121697836 isoform X2 [Alosa sapidissima]|uniref:uncharacterized protein LOC121697836 isoform X2 n=1 Tax=Alosa sapidissima TaxID=34773 RepID=UPI001C08DAC5|nr:uncharacterized protein LOC121697836 isoform X2 [Alosa sapidissima]
MTQTTSQLYILSRIMMKNDTKKQREYFAKKRLENKLQTLGLPTSPKRESTGSMDLVTLFIVNQIATKKTKASQPKVTHFRELKGPNRARPGQLLALPMSPCSPSRLPLAEVQPLHSTPFERERTFVKKRKTHFSLFKQPELSPVLESNLSDISAPDYQHHVRDSFSPYSVASPASVSSAGLFPSHQPSRTHIHTSPNPWDITQPERSQFNPYFHPSGERERESVRWAGEMQAATAGHTHHTHTTTTTMPVTRVQFGGIETITIEGRGHDTRTAGFPLGAAGKSTPQEPFFRDFCSDEYNTQAPYDKEVMKIHLPEKNAISTITKGASETFMSSAVDLGGIVESQQRGAEQDLVRTMFTCADSRQDAGYEQVSVRSESPSYSPREGCNPSDSDDEEDDCCCQHNTHDALEASCTRKCVELDTPFLNSHSTFTQHDLSDIQQHSQNADKGRMAHKSGRPVPCDAAKNRGRWRGCGEDQYVPARAAPGNTHQPGGRTAEPPAAIPQPAPQTQEVGTQTTPIPRPTLTDASTQWCPPRDIRSTAAETEHHHYPKSPSYMPAVPPRFTRGQYEHKNELLKKASQNWLSSATTPAESHTHTHTHSYTREQNTPWQTRGGAHTHSPIPTPECNRFGPTPSSVSAAAPLHTWAQQHGAVRHPCAAVAVDQPPTPVLGVRSRILHQHSTEEVRREHPSVLGGGGEEDRQEGDGRRVAEQSAEQERCENLTLSEATTRAGERDTEEAVEEEEERGEKSVSEEAETLQEIADILLMMKRRKK